MSWLDKLETLESTKMSLSKVLEAGKGREAWSAAVHSVAELELASQLENSNNSVSHMSEIFKSEIWNSLYPHGKSRFFFL